MRSWTPKTHRRQQSQGLGTLSLSGRNTSLGWRVVYWGALAVSLMAAYRFGRYLVTGHAYSGDGKLPPAWRA